MSSFIYTRTHPYYQNQQIIKLGVTDNIPERNSTYLTSEYISGTFTNVIRIPSSRRTLLDNHLKDVLKPYHKQNSGGTEFYDESISTKIIPILNNLNIDYKILRPDEIQGLLRKQRNQKICFKKKPQLKPTSHQQNVLENISVFYQQHHKGKLIWACGLGKALTSLFIVKKLEYTKICIGVPTIFLQTQFKKEILQLFPKNNILFIGGNKHNHIDEIKIKLKNATINNPLFVITTYSSCNRLIEDDIVFDFIIGDEAHHLVSASKDINKKTYDKFHLIKTKKKLFMTATERIITNNIKDVQYSMDDTSIFGEYIDKKTILWAIENKKITDYNVSILKNNVSDINLIINSCQLSINPKQQELFLSAYMCVLCLSGYLSKYKSLSHVLIYCNTIQHAKLVDDFITIILKNNIIETLPRKNQQTIRMDNIYHKHTDTEIDLERELEIFKNADKGIICCVFKLGEGVDLKYLNGVVFAEHMGSEIRTVQSAARPLRLNTKNPYKIAFIFIPLVIDNERLDTTYNDEYKYNNFEKILDILDKMGNEDSNIEQRITISTLPIPKNKNSPTQNQKEQLYVNDIDNNHELDTLKLNLKYRKNVRYSLSPDQDEYNFCRSMNKRFDLQSKEDYLKLYRSEFFIENVKEYFSKKGIWENWYHFLGIDTSGFIQDKDLWKKYCNTRNIKSLSEYKKISLIDTRLPTDPGEFYKGFSNIGHELEFYNRRRR